MNKLAVLGGLAAGVGALVYATKKASAKTPAGQPALTPLGPGTYNEAGDVVLPDGRIVDPETGKVTPAPGGQEVAPTPDDDRPPSPMGHPAPVPVAPPPYVPPQGLPPLDAASPGQPTGTKPSTTVPVAPGGIPQAIGERMALAIASGDPATIRAEANKLRAEGYVAQAATLDAIAIEIQRVKQPVPAAPSPFPAQTLPPPPQSSSPPAIVGNTYKVVKGDTPYGIAKRFTGDGNRYKELAAANPSKKANILAGKIYVGEVLTLPSTWVGAPAASPVPLPPASSAVDPLKVEATALVFHLRQQPASSPASKALVMTYQSHNPDAGKADGLYGPKTALSLIKYGLVPPTPYYWPSATMAAAKRDYRNQLNAQAAKDPPRAQEWIQARDAVK